jgi:hypothetical protein
MKKSIFLILLFVTVSLHAKPDKDRLYEQITANIPEGKVLTITEFKGNYAKEFTKELTQYIRESKEVYFIDYDIHKKVLDENIKYSEPVFDNKYSAAMPNLVSPDISIFGSANMQKSNFFFKRKEHLDYEINLVELSTGLILYNVNDRLRIKYNPPILLLIILIVLVLAVARWVIFLRRGYNVHYILFTAMLFITIIIVWYLL